MIKEKQKEQLMEISGIKKKSYILSDINHCKVLSVNMDYLHVPDFQWEWNDMTQFLILLLPQMSTYGVSIYLDKGTNNRIKKKYFLL